MANVDVNKPVENPVLVQLFEERKNVQAGDEKQLQLMNNICRYIANDGLFLAVLKAPGKDSTKSYELITATTGDKYLPVYTDLENLKKHPMHQKAYVHTGILTIEHMSAMIEHVAGVVINPFSHNFVVQKDLLEHMMKTKKQMNLTLQETEVDHDTQVKLGDPKNYPQEMTDAISEYAKTNPDINAIYLRLMKREDEISFLLVVDYTGDRGSIFEGIARAAQKYMPVNMYLNLVSYEEPFGKDAATNEPFYKK